MRTAIQNYLITDSWVNRSIVGAVLVGFLALLVSGLAAFHSVRENQTHTHWVQHTYEVEREISTFSTLLERAETGRRGYLLSGAPNAATTYYESSSTLLPTIDRLRALTSDNTRQQIRFQKLIPLVQGALRSLDQSVDMVRNGQRDEAVARFRETLSQGQLRQIRALTEAIRAEEDGLLTIRDRAQADSLQLFYVTGLITGLVLLLVGGGSIWIILRYTRDLSSSRNMLQALNSNLEGAVRERTTDLQRANDEIQRFAYIVSHDLRSPLVNVMGFTAELEAANRQLTALVDRLEAEAPELASRDAMLAAREDLPEAIGFIRTSTQKMDRLINAILRLSREGRRPITPERLDMTVLAQGIADTLRHRVDEIGAEITVQPGLPEIVSDRVAVEQVLSNIIENATKYLKADTPGRIAVRGQREASRAVFEIVDNGRGVDPRDHDRIFDLFRRSGVQDQPGEGIGLAHTRALAYRLGGTITVKSRLGEGATFRVVLPLVFQGEQGASS